MLKPDSNKYLRNLFDELVGNAIDFLNRSIRDFKKDPKMSIINFYTSIELFLKARLMKEHWALIYENPKNASYKDFISGDFKSITFDEAVKRLNKIAGVFPSGVDDRCFAILRKNRNRLIHFFDPAYNKPDQNILIEVVSEQCKAWFHLYNWLSNDWNEEFEHYSPKIQQLNNLMKKHREFLEVKYKQLIPRIKSEEGKGTSFKTCRVCGFEACRITHICEPLIENNCIVCDNVYRQLKVPCPKCGTAVYMDDVDEAKCSKERCRGIITMKYLIGLYGQHKVPRDELIEPSNAYCSECEYTSIRCVVPLENGFHLCLNCLAMHNEISHCEYCGEMVTGNTEDSYLIGCVICEGCGIPD